VLFGVDPLDHSVTEALHALGMQVQAGIPLVRSLTSCGQMCRLASARAAFTEAAQGADAGKSFDQILASLGGVLSYTERTILAAGWEAGRAEEAIGLVVEQRQLMYRTRREMRTHMLLPAVTFTAACIIAPLPRLFLGGTMREYLFSSLGPLVGAAAVLLIVRVAGRWRQRRHAGHLGDRPPAAGMVDRLGLALPVWGLVERRRNQSEFGLLMGNLLSAGISLIDALRLAAIALPNGVYRQQIAVCREAVIAGGTLSEALSTAGRWPPTWIASLEVGEVSGELDTALRRLGEQAHEGYVRAVRALGTWLPRLIYALVSLYIIYLIFQLWGGVLQATGI